MIPQRVAIRDIWSSWPEWRNCSNFNREGLNVPRGLMFVSVLPVPAIILAALDKQQYLLSAALRGLLVGLSDAGGEFGFPARRMAEVAMVGALLSALGSGIGAGAWETSRRPRSWSRRCPVLALLPMERQHERSSRRSKLAAVSGRQRPREGWNAAGG